MRCKTVLAKLDRLSSMELAPGMQERVEAHLSACANCRHHRAEHKRLAAFLTSHPQPPTVPEGFGDRVMASALERQARRESVPGSLWRPRWLSLPAAIGRQAPQFAALAAGLLIGVFMGHQTWRSAHSPIPPSTVQPDPIAIYELDSLTDAPRGSLVQSYLILTKGPNLNGQ